jgi:hypothetical protein
LRLTQHNGPEQTAVRGIITLKGLTDIQSLVSGYEFFTKDSWSWQLNSGSVRLMADGFSRFSQQSTSRGASNNLFVYGSLIFGLPKIKPKKARSSPKKVVF